MKKAAASSILIIIVLAVFVLANSFYVIDEGTQCVVIRFGEIVRATTKAGLNLKIPLLETTVVYPKKVMSLEGDSQRIPTRENQFIIVETTSRWRIVDPVKFYESVTTTETAYSRLRDIVDSAVRTVITSSGLNEVVRSSNLINDLQHEENFALGSESEDVEMEDFTGEKIVYETIERGRHALSSEMADIAREKVPEFGIELLDIVPRQIRYSDELTESVYNRMIKERNQIAQRFRSAGEGRKAVWQGMLENERRRLLSGAYSEAEKIRGQADAEAARIYAEAYGKDPEFFRFWRSIEAYRKTVPNFDKVLSTDMDFFRYLYSPSGR